jgi:hypothetical protein
MFASSALACIVGALRYQPFWPSGAAGVAVRELAGAVASIAKLAVDEALRPDASVAVHETEWLFESLATTTSPSWCDPVIDSFVRDTELPSSLHASPLRLASSALAWTVTALV